MSQPALKKQIEDLVVKVAADYKLNTLMDPVLSKVDTSKAVTKSDLNRLLTYQILLATGPSAADAIVEMQEYERRQRVTTEWLESNGLSSS
jgi:hypothetical protein